MYKHYSEYKRWGNRFKAFQEYLKWKPKHPFDYPMCNILLSAILDKYDRDLIKKIV